MPRKDYEITIYIADFPRLQDWKTEWRFIMQEIATLFEEHNEVFQPDSWWKLTKVDETEDFAGRIWLHVTIGAADLWEARGETEILRRRIHKLEFSPHRVEIGCKR